LKYLLFWEQNEMDPAERAEFSRGAREARRDEERFGKVILAPHFYETYKGVTVVEIDDPKQLANRMTLVAPYTRIRAVPLIRSTMFSESAEELSRA